MGGVEWGERDRETKQYKMQRKRCLTKFKDHKESQCGLYVLDERENDSR